MLIPCLQSPFGALFRLSHLTKASTIKLRNNLRNNLRGPPGPRTITTSMPRANTSSPKSSPAPAEFTARSSSPEPRKHHLPEGCFAVHKPSGISSAQVIRDLQSHFNRSTTFAPLIDAERASRQKEGNFQQKRRRKAKQDAGQVKMGHGGTLDPAATGVLIVGVGKGTKELQRFLECTKEYECIVLFGAATDSYDAEGKVVGRKPYAHVTKALVEEKLEKFRGKIMQRPPIYSALHVQGKRLYEYAREGLEVPIEIQERPVEVNELKLVSWLEGGKHPHEWPAQEADEAAKIVAQKTMNLNKKEVNLPKKQEAEPHAPDLKRKRTEEDDDGVHETSESKRLKEDKDAPSMSGALQPAETKGETNGEPDEALQQDEAETSANPPADGAPESDPPQPPAALITMTVTSGFYVRSFCHDLGAAVDSLAFMSSLIRSRQGEFSLEKGVLEYDDLKMGEEHWGPKVQAMLDDWNEKYETTRMHRGRTR